MKERGLRSSWVPGGCWGCSRFTTKEALFHHRPGRIGSHDDLCAGTFRRQPMWWRRSGTYVQGGDVACWGELEVECQPDRAAREVTGYVDVGVVACVGGEDVVVSVMALSLP
jgi:hypothetical protein